MYISFEGQAKEQTYQKDGSTEADNQTGGKGEQAGRQVESMNQSRRHTAWATETERQTDTRGEKNQTYRQTDQRHTYK